MVTLKRAFEASNLHALIIKIVGGTFEPIADIYSEDLRLLILSMLHRDPNKRPHINQIISQPKIINHIMYLYTDWGKIPSIRIQRPLSSMQPTSRCRQSAQVCNLSSRGSDTSTSETSSECSGSERIITIEGRASTSSDGEDSVHVVVRSEEFLRR
ncbi:NEK8 [Acanthosepion pharaonis]|uniref:non-specific serine/threonine protein kinase n=1 Tax=Acanthosepion pharaonis TaxID=158019 RepID=A0A812DJX6_ACAPH|nr:NEK8 [Sepia pharaonis]